MKIKCGDLVAHKPPGYLTGHRGGEPSRHLALVMEVAPPDRIGTIWARIEYTDPERRLKNEGVEIWAAAAKLVVISGS